VDPRAGDPTTQRAVAVRGEQCVFGRPVPDAHQGNEILAAGHALGRGAHGEVALDGDGLGRSRRGGLGRSGGFLGLAADEGEAGEKDEERGLHKTLIPAVPPGGVKRSADDEPDRCEGVLDDEADRIQHRHEAGGGLVEVVADGVLEQGDVGEGVVLRDADGLAELWRAYSHGGAAGDGRRQGQRPRVGRRD